MSYDTGSSGNSETSNLYQAPHQTPVLVPASPRPDLHSLPQSDVFMGRGSDSHIASLPSGPLHPPSPYAAGVYPSVSADYVGQYTTVNTLPEFGTTAWKQVYPAPQREPRISMNAFRMPGYDPAVPSYNHFSPPLIRSPLSAHTPDTSPSHYDLAMDYYSNHGSRSNSAQMSETSIPSSRSLSAEDVGRRASAPPVDPCVARPPPQRLSAIVEGVPVFSHAARPPPPIPYHAKPPIPYHTKPTLARAPAPAVAPPVPPPLPHHHGHYFPQYHPPQHQFVPPQQQLVPALQPHQFMPPAYPGQIPGIFPQYPYPLPSFQPPIPKPSSPSSSRNIILTRFTKTIKDEDSLKDGSTWLKWSQAVMDSLNEARLLGHICSSPAPGVVRTVWNTPIYRPLVSSPALPGEVEAQTAWDNADTFVMSILTIRLHDDCRALLPGFFNELGERRDSRETFAVLRNACEATRDMSSASAIERALTVSSVSKMGNDVYAFILKWTQSIAELQSMDYPVHWDTMLHHFIAGFPDRVDYKFVRNECRKDMKSMTPSKSLFNEFCIRLKAARDEELSAPKRSDNQSGGSSVPSGHVGHGGANSGGNGGGNRRGKKGGQGHNNGSNSDASRDGANPNPNINPKSNTNTHTNANTNPNTNSNHFSMVTAKDITNTTSGINSVPSSPVIVENTNTISRSSYSSSLVKPLVALSHLETLLDLEKADPVSYASVVRDSPPLLDSACTFHIVKDRRCFFSYDSGGAVDVTTANAGTLSTKASGICYFKAPIADSTDYLIIKMFDCLHAPDAPVNLVSTGAMIEHNFSLYMSRGIVKVYIPDTTKKFIVADVKHRLCLLRGEFLLNTEPVSSEPVPISMPVFSRRIPNGDLFHERFGHIGKERTNELLSGGYATGLEKWNGTKMKGICDSCLKGKHPHSPFAHDGHRRSLPLELIVLDTCGPIPCRSPHGNHYFNVILDDATSAIGGGCFAKKSQAIAILDTTVNVWENQLERTVKSARVDGAGEHIGGAMKKWFVARGIMVQETAPYAHWQNGKAERWVRVIENDAMTLLAHSGLPLQFWEDAVLTAIYLRFRMPTSTLPKDVTPFEMVTKLKPDLGHLRVWGCQCWFQVPEEKRRKFGVKMVEGIFVGYEEGRVGWRVRDLAGGYHFVEEAEFNETQFGKLGGPRVSRSLMDSLDDSVSSSEDPDMLPIDSASTPAPDNSTSTPTPDSGPRRSERLKQKEGNWDNGIRLRDERLVDLRSQRTPSALYSASAVEAAHSFSWATEILGDGMVALEDDEPTISTAFLNVPDTILSEHPRSFALVTREVDLSKPPATRREMLRRSDVDKWLAAEAAENKGLFDRGVFERVDRLPKGRHAIKTKYVYDIKSDGRFKARLVAQGFSQRPEDYGKTYAPVARLVSIRVVLAWAAAMDWELFSFDVKQAFLNADLQEEVYVSQIPGYPDADKDAVYRLIRTLYGLQQAPRAWYLKLLESLLKMQLVRLACDAAVFFGRWLEPPHPSVPMPSDGSPLYLIIPVHVDDGLSATNSPALYKWFISKINTYFETIDQGPVSLYVGLRITRDRARRLLWISQEHYIDELLEQHNLTVCTTNDVPLKAKLDREPIKADSQSVPEVEDKHLVKAFQALVGSLLFLAIYSRPDISYTVMNLAQYNSKPKRHHLAAAKGVLRYLAGTKNWSLQYGGAVRQSLSKSLNVDADNCAITDADWGSDESDRRSVSGYAFFLFGGLVAWSAVKQKSIALSSTESEYMALTHLLKEALTESEYMALTHLLKEALWIRIFGSLAALEVPRPFVLLSDNQSSLEIANSDSVSSRSKHIDIRYHFIRFHISEGSFVTVWVPTKDNIADVFTKSLPGDLHHKHCLSLGLIPR